MNEGIIGEVEKYLSENVVYLQTAKNVESLIGRKVIFDYPAFLTKQKEGTIVLGSGFLKDNGCNLHNFLGQDENSETGAIADRVYEFISREPNGELSKFYLSSKAVEVKGNIVRVREGIMLDLSFHNPRTSITQQELRTLEEAL